MHALPPAPYPFDRLPKLTRAQLHAHARMHALLDGFVHDELASTSQRLLGAPMRAQLDEQAPLERVGREQLAQRLLGPLCAVLLERATGGRAHCLAIECTPSLAALLVNRTLGGDGEAALAQGQQPLDDLSRGVLAYLVARLLADAGSGFVLRAVLCDGPALRAAISGNTDADETWLAAVDLQLGARRATLRMWVPDALLTSIAPLPRSQPPLSAWLHELPVGLCAEAGRAVLDIATVESLELGDVVVLDESGLVHEAATFAGSVCLRIARGEPVFLCRAYGTQIEIERICAGERSLMTIGKIVTTEAQPNHLSKLAASAPVELSAELARFSLSFGELTELAPGSVLVTGRRIGEAVTLRAAGRAIAEGELVDVEGEVGVRVLRLLPDER